VLRLAKVTGRTWSGISAAATDASGDGGQGIFLQGVRFRHRSERVKDSLANVRQHGLERLSRLKRRDIFTLDLSNGPTIVTVYLLPSLNAKLLPQLQKLPLARASFRSRTACADIKRTSKSWLIRSWANSMSTCGR